MNKTKNVKVIIGQGWAIDDSEFKLMQMNGDIDNPCVSVGYGWINIDEFYEKFTFIPQTDLEFLAVNAELNEPHEFIARNGAGCMMWIFYPSNFNKEEIYTQQYNLAFHRTLSIAYWCIAPEMF